MKCRLPRPCPPPASLGQAIACYVKHGEKPMKAIAADIGCQYDYLKSAANPHRDDTQFQLRWLIPILRSTGDLSLLRFIAAQVGCALVELPAPAVTDDDVLRRLAQVMDELGQGSAETIHALADGTLTAEEARRAGRQCDDVVDAALAWKASLSARVGKPKAARMTNDPTKRSAVSA